MTLAEFTSRVFSAPDSTTNAHELTSSDGICLDVSRASRCGFPEVIFGAGKSLAAIRAAVDGLLRHGQPVLVTRLDEAFGAELQRDYAGGRYHAVARTFSLGRAPSLPDAKVAIVTAGTSDFPVAAEASETLRWMGIEADLIQDVGVAGPQRLQMQLPRLQDCQVVIVIAGFEGALPSVVGGHLDCVVIGVPTSNSFGGGLQGIAPLLAMINSCAPNVTVVNIDAGFKAGYLAGIIAKQATRGCAAIPAAEMSSTR
jgi:NCAIR mutase (PurE)-related protein